MEATPGDIGFLRDAKTSKIVKQAEASRAGAILCPDDFSLPGKSLIHVKNPIAAFSKVLHVIFEERRAHPPKGIHTTAVVSTRAVIGKGVVVGPHCVVEDDVIIQDNVTLLAHVYVGARSKIGSASFLYPQVTIREDISIGNNCILHPGAVIGADGFGYFFSNGQHNKIPQVGTVIIEDDVEIGACATIDRGTTGQTIIKKGSKIDNLVHVAHNVSVGPCSILAAQTGVAGSSKIGAGVILGGQVGVADHITIADGVQAGGQTGINTDILEKSALFGTPAQPVKESLRQSLLLKRLPELFKEIKELKERIKNQ
ncbi:MAG: UDP-3-O-acylglucosamine N-acyltransferase [Elusimicrobia bacterium]|nr:UDP-3-O-acylglucosamine N-acyltransferase [Elusimicrobiota bacterium]